MLAVLAVVYRPLLFASTDPDVAVARGVPVRLSTAERPGNGQKKDPVPLGGGDGAFRILPPWEVGTGTEMQEMVWSPRTSAPCSTRLRHQAGHNPGATGTNPG